LINNRGHHTDYSDHQLFSFAKQEAILGRDPNNDVSISDPEVSRRHARFIYQNENYLIEDLGSTNGTFLNGNRLSSPQQLRPGDVITFGESIIVVFENASYDPDATVVSSQPVQAGRAAYPQQAPVPQPYKSAPEPASAYPPPPMPRESQPAKKRGFPTWLIILIIAIVVVVCVIAVIFWFMPASWWCAITFDMLEGCPLP